MVLRRYSVGNVALRQIVSWKFLHILLILLAFKARRSISEKVIIYKS